MPGGRIPRAPAASAGRTVSEEGSRHAGHVASAPQESGRHAVAAWRLKGARSFARDTAAACCVPQLLIRSAVNQIRSAASL